MIDPQDEVVEAFNNYFSVSHNSAIPSTFLVTPHPTPEDANPYDVVTIRIDVAIKSPISEHTSVRVFSPDDPEIVIFSGECKEGNDETAGSFYLRCYAQDVKDLTLQMTSTFGSALDITGTYVAGSDPLNTYKGNKQTRLDRWQGAALIATLAAVVFLCAVDVFWHWQQAWPTG